MKFAGSKSWSFTESAGEQFVHSTLFVRDAFGLQPKGDPLVPPPLVNGPGPRNWRADWPEREQAGQDWVGWYRAALATVVNPRAGEIRGHLAAIEATFDEPGFESMAARPGLQCAARDAWADGSRWSGALGPRPGIDGPQPSLIAWDLIRQTAEDVAFDRYVDIGAVHGHVVVLDVQGSWWQEAGRGVMTCSANALKSAATAHAIVRRVFESGLERGPG